jgi:Leucine-rich repeat (LRR) protein
LDLDLSKNLHLKTLSCSFNQLSVIDISKNNKLETLLCNYNKLTSLDIQNHTSLINLMLTNNQIAALDVSRLSNLNRLECNNNLLTNLDLSNNKVLEFLRCENNKLINLNLKNANNEKIASSYTNYPNFKNNPDLTCILVDNKSYSDTNWSSKKDLSMNFSESCTLGTDSVFFATTIISPNPTHGLLTINNTALDQVKVYNLLGQLQKSFVILTNQENHTFDLSTLSKGVYFIILENNNEIAKRKIIIN